MKKILSVLLVLVLIASLFVACDTNQQETGSDLDKAVEYLATTYKGAEGKETSNDYELIPQISIDGVSYTVTWTVDNENIKITKNETSGFYVVDLPANNAEKCEYTLTATVTAPDGTTATKTMKRVLPVLSNVEGVVTEPVANTAYKLFFDQKSVGKVLFLTAETSGNYIKTVVDPKAAADFNVEAAEGGFRVYTLVNGAKSYIKATTIPKEDGKVSKVIGFDAAGSVFKYNAEINAWYTAIDGVNYTMGTYGTYETVSISEDSYYTPENTGVSQFPVQFIEKAAGEAMAPSVGPAEPTELTSIKDAVAMGLAMAHNTFTVEKYLVKGTVVEVVNTTYGNLYIEDAEGNKIYVYGLYNEDGSVRFDALATQPKVGDVLTVMGVVGQYNDAAQIKNGWIKKLDAVVCEHTYSAACDATCNKCGATRTAEAHVYDNACDADCNVCAEARDVEGHKYDNVCDADCNTCGTERDVEGHKYDNACDADCNTCGTAREVEGHKYDSACDADCNTCGTEREVGDHVYNNACDADCNVCGAKREAEDHKYDNACDATCNVCGANREVAAHVYDNDCDADCNVCGAKRVVADHVYDNACDAECNSCGAKREVEDHKYDNACDATCNVCGAKREVEDHKYDNACDATCNVCGANREVAAHVYDNDCDADCNVCGAKRAVADHVYDNACDADCNVCGAEREASAHVYNNACDADCNVCGTKREVEDHKYDNACDATCNVCGANREVAAHVYDNECDATCNVCGATREVAAHVYDNDCDSDCNVCGAKRAAADHVYDNACDADCNVCGTKREASAHVYNNACDVDCNVCGTKREVEDHVYADDCDDECDICGVERLAPHIYSAECDEKCDVCGSTRTVAVEHKYDNDCDKDCNNCKTVRKADCVDSNEDGLCDSCGKVIDEAEVDKGHIEYEVNQINFVGISCGNAIINLPLVGREYSDVTITWVCETVEIVDGKITFAVTDKEYTVAISATFACGEQKETVNYNIKVPAHVYDNVCDAGCNKCEAVRETAGHVYDNACDADCGVCGATRTPAAHVYDNDCDADCNVCGAKRAVADHVYDNACDVDCNVCKAVRENVADHVYDNACDADCNVCKAVRENVAGHVYDNACDVDCNTCGVKRETSHTYANACDADCDVCGATRTPEAHVYDNDCDADCNVCGAKRTVKDHIYDNACDADCNVCGAEREAEGHKYDNTCDVDCNNCGLKRETSHTYTNACDAVCDVCGATRTPEPHVYDNDCDADCNVCELKRTPAEHVYDNACDADCNVCKAVRENVAGHVYDNPCDVDCNNCGFERAVDDHKYANCDDETCDYCGATRTAPGHVYDNACDGTCANCDATRTPADHVYDNACDADCNVCGEKREPAAHEYDNCEDAACNVCDASRTAGTCADANSDDKCDTCGAEMSTFPKVGTAYAFSFIRDNANYYFLGKMSGYYVATSTSLSDAVNVYFEKANDGYYMYFGTGAEKTYVNVVNEVGTDGREHLNIKLEAAATTVYTYDATINTMVTKIGEDVVFIGGRGTYNTMSAYRYSADSTDLHLGVYVEAIDPSTCKHNYTEATCSTAKTCTICGNVDGNALGHTEANAEGKCDRCGFELVISDEGALSILDAIAMGSAKENNTYTAEKYFVVGEITEIYNETYGNMKIKDAAGNILTIYGTYSADGSQRFDAMTTKPAVGDTIKVYGVIGNYNNTPQMKNGWIGHTHNMSDATCTSAKACACGYTEGEKLGHNYTSGKCTRCGADEPVAGATLPSNLIFTDAANKASADDYMKAHFPQWTITGKLGQTYGGYLGFGRSGDGTSAITSSDISVTSAFTVTAVLKGNGNNGTMTSTLTFTLVDASGNTVATGSADGVTVINPVDAKDTTYNISFTFVSGKTWTDVTNLVVSFSKGVGNIGLKSLDFVQ